MKTKKLLILFILNLFFFSSCKKNELKDDSVLHDYRVNNVLYSKNAKLKQILSVESVNSEKNGLITSEYEYDEFRRISKVSNPLYENGKIVGVSFYTLYFYNDKNQLEKTMNYIYKQNSGFINGDNKIYFYDDKDNLLKIAIQSQNTDSIFYFYKYNLLSREEYYSGFLNRVTTYTEYEYNIQNELIFETVYLAENNSISRTISHNYQEGLNVKTEVFVIITNLKKDKMREIKRYYDKNDNLIYLESKELTTYSSASSYVEKYEYY